MTTLRYYPEKEGIERWLGPLEGMLMEYLWSCTCPRTLAQIYYFRGEGRAKTTIQTTLWRLTKKGLLIFDRPHGRDGRYSPAEPRDVWEARMLAIVRASLEE